jgi:hypothetical protein
MTTVLQHFDSSFRADGFYLLCNDPRGTADLTSEEIALIRECLYLSMDIQHPSSRYIIICGLKKIFIRIIRVVYAQWRDVNKLEVYLKLLIEEKKTEESKELSSTKSKIAFYQEALTRKANFLSWLYGFIVSLLDEIRLKYYLTVNVAKFFLSWSLCTKDHYRFGVY